MPRSLHGCLESHRTPFHMFMSFNAVSSVSLEGPLAKEYQKCQKFCSAGACLKNNNNILKCFKPSFKKASVARLDAL